MICLLSGSDYVSWVAYLREKALNDEERPAVRMRALTALQAALTEDQMMEHMELHSYTLNLRIKVLNFLSRLEVLGLVYKVGYCMHQRMRFPPVVTILFPISAELKTSLYKLSFP